MSVCHTSASSSPGGLTTAVDASGAPSEPIKKVLAACRSLGYHVMHTREGHRPDLSDLPANKRWRSEQIGAAIGGPGPKGRILVRGRVP